MEAVRWYDENLERLSDGAAFATCVNLMDDELREEIHAEHQFDDDERGFLVEYAGRHAERFGEEFSVG